MAVLGFTSVRATWEEEEKKKGFSHQNSVLNEGEVSAKICFSLSSGYKSREEITKTS